MRHTLNPWMVWDTTTVRMLSILTIILGALTFFFTDDVFGTLSGVNALVAVGNLFMMETCVSKHWIRGELQYTAWEKYRALPKQYRNTINFKETDLADYTEGQLNAFVSKINVIANNYRQISEAKGLDDALAARLDSVIEADQQSLDIHRQVTAEIAARDENN